LPKGELEACAPYGAAGEKKAKGGCLSPWKRGKGKKILVVGSWKRGP